MADQTGVMARARQLAQRMVGVSRLANTNNMTGNTLARAESYYNYDSVTVSMLLGSGYRSARARVQIYQKYQFMLGDGIINSAIMAHVTNALGGDERSSQTVFLDILPFAEKDKALSKIAGEIRDDLIPLLNKIAHQSAFNGAGFGDSYGRVYTGKREGVVEINIDEMVYPPLVQPYVRGNQTVGYVVSTGEKFTERLSITQLARLKMPRTYYVPQIKVIDKSFHTAITEDDITKLPILPELIGGSFLDAAEFAYDNLIKALLGLVGQRVINSIDESMIQANLEGMTIQQRKLFMESLKKMLTESKARAECAVKEGRPITERIYHIMPTSSEKQLTAVQPFTGTGGSTSITIEDVLFHAKLLAGALGIDMSMLGFSDILSGGLGEGGFFRTSVQGAQRSQVIRTGLADFFYEIIDLHCLARYGFVFAPKDRPYAISFYSTNSALETEQQLSREKAANTSTLILGVFDQLKNLGLDEVSMNMIIEQIMEFPEDFAKVMAKALATSIAQKKAEDAAAAQQNGNNFGE